MVEMSPDPSVTTEMVNILVPFGLRERVNPHRPALPTTDMEPLDIGSNVGSETSDMGYVK